MATENNDTLAGQLQEDYLTCHICFDTYRRPKALPCLHSFCRECLDSFIESHKKSTSTRNQQGPQHDKFPCPLCRIDVTVPQEGATGFPDNHILISLCDTLDIAHAADDIDQVTLNSTNHEDLGTLQGPTNEQEIAPMNAPSGGVIPSAPSEDTISIISNPVSVERRTASENQAETDFNQLPGYVRTFGQYGPGFAEFTYPTGLAVTKSGYVLVSDQRDNRVLVYDLHGNYYKHFSTEGNVRNVTFGGYDTLMVAVTSADKSLCHRYKLDGTKIQSYGNMFRHEHAQGVALAPNGNIVISTLDTCTIYILNPSGKMIKQFGTKGNDLSKLSTPFYITVNSKNDIFVSDCEQNSIKVYSLEGKLKNSFGGSYKNPQQLWYPKGIAIDNNDNILVADFGNQCVKQFSAAGKFIQDVVVFPKKLPSTQYRPINVAIGDDLLLVLASVGMYQVQIFIFDYDQRTEMSSDQSASKFCSLM